MFLKKKNKDEYNVGDLYIVHLSDLYLLTCNSFEHKSIRDFSSGSICYLINKETSDDVIILEVLEENGKKYLFDILTNTKIFLFTDRNSAAKRLKNLNTDWIFTKKRKAVSSNFDKYEIYSSKQILSIDDCQFLFVNVNAIKPINNILDSEMLSLYDYNINFYLENRKRIIEFLLISQQEELNKLASVQKQLEELHLTCEEIEDFKNNFDNFTQKVKTKQLKFK